MPRRHASSGWRSPVSPAPRASSTFASGRLVTDSMSEAQDDFLVQSAQHLDQLDGQLDRGLPASQRVMSELGAMLGCLHSIRRSAEGLQLWPIVAAARGGERLVAEAIEVGGPVDPRRVDVLMDVADMLRTLTALTSSPSSSSPREPGASRSRVEGTAGITMDRVLNSLPSVAEDLAARLGKQIRVEVLGGGVQVEWSVLEVLGPSLLHLVRSIVSDGIELPEIRRKRGKPAEGTVRISAGYRAGALLVRVVDDGEATRLDREAAAFVHGPPVFPEQLAVAGVECVDDVAGVGEKHHPIVNERRGL